MRLSRTKPRSPRGAKLRALRRLRPPADALERFAAKILVPADRRDRRVLEPGPGIAASGRGAPDGFRPILPVAEARANDLAGFMSKQRLGENRENSQGLVSVDDADPLCHDVDEAEDVADGEIVESHRGELRPRPADPCELKVEKPG